MPPNVPATRAVALPAPNALKGILFMCAAASIFPIMNGLVKLLSGLGGGYSSEQVVWARTTSHLVFVLLLFMPTRGPAIFASRRFGWQLIRGVMLLLSTAFFFFGVKFVPLAKAATVSFCAPFFVVALSVFMLNERASLRRWITIGVGFVGVLIVIRPGSAVFHWASILTVASALCYSFYQIFTRRVAGHDSPETSVVYSAFVGTLVMSAVLLFMALMPSQWQSAAAAAGFAGWKTPQSWLDLLLLCSLGVLGGAGHYCVARAMTYAPAYVVSPFHYVQLIGSVLIGYALFDDIPDMFVWLGAAVIIGSGVYIIWDENRLQKERAAGAG